LDEYSKKKNRLDPNMCGLINLDWFLDIQSATCGSFLLI